MSGMRKQTRRGVVEEGWLLAILGSFPQVDNAMMFQLGPADSGEIVEGAVHGHHSPQIEGRCIRMDLGAKAYRMGQ